MYYRWIKMPSDGEIYLPKLGLRIVTSDMPTVHTLEGTYFPNEWMRVEDGTPETDVWFFEQAPVRAVAVKTIYRSAWSGDRWIKLFP